MILQESDLFPLLLAVFSLFVGFLGFLFALTEVFIKDHDEVMKGGFFQGYNGVVWTLVTVQVNQMDTEKEPLNKGHVGSSHFVERLSALQK